MTKRLYRTDEEVEECKGSSFLLSWGENEILSIFTTSDIYTAMEAMREYQGRQYRKYIPFDCTHNDCPRPLGYLYDFGLQRFTSEDSRNLKDGESTVTVSGGIFVPNPNKVQMEKLRLGTLYKKGVITAFVAMGH